MAVIDMKDRTKVINVFLDAKFKQAVEYYIKNHDWQDLEDSILDNKAILPEAMAQALAKVISQSMLLAATKDIWNATTKQMGQIVAGLLPKATGEFEGLSEDAKEFVWIVVFDAVILNFAQDLLDKPDYRKKIGIR